MISRNSTVDWLSAGPPATAREMAYSALVYSDYAQSMPIRILVCADKLRTGNVAMPPHEMTEEALLATQSVPSTSPSSSNASCMRWTFSG